VAKDHGWDVEGIEFSSDTAELARSSYGLHVHTGTLETYKPDNGLFDCLTMWDVIEHVRDPSNVLLRANEMLKTGGYLLMTTPNIDGILPRFSYPIASRFGIWRHPEPPQHLFQFSERTIRSLCEKSGFHVVEIVHDRIPFVYTFGNPLGMVKPWRLAEWLAFAPLALIGPWIGAGDTICVVAQK
jgi:2-polyprenyl-3-methyl-5-hydroxy-6-metoxy-1,4-benzoquinol methylase